jgi:hypothetical protein
VHDSGGVQTIAVGDVRRERRLEDRYVRFERRCSGQPSRHSTQRHGVRLLHRLFARSSGSRADHSGSVRHLLARDRFANPLDHYAAFGLLGDLGARASSTASRARLAQAGVLLVAFTIAIAPCGWGSADPADPPPGTPANTYITRVTATVSPAGQASVTLTFPLSLTVP